MKKLIALFAPVSDDRLKEIQTSAPDYEVKRSDSLTAVDDEQIEIILGWDRSLHEKQPATWKSLKWIQLVSAGTDYLPDTLRHHSDVMISTTSGMHAKAVTEAVYAYILSQVRGFYPALEAQGQGKWLDVPTLGYETLPGKTILVYGTGQIGGEIGRIGQAFGLTTIGVNSNGRAVAHFDTTVTMATVTDYISQADYIVNALPLTDKTRGLFNAAFFKCMKAQGIFINIGRGPSVVQNDLYEALKASELSGAYLDVFEKEPLEEGSPLWSCPNLIITPHMTGKMNDYHDHVYRIFMENLHQYVQNGQLARNQYNPVKDY